MRSVRQCVGWYLVLCLLGGAAVGFSPLLHHWVEHGGVGDRHSHALGWPGELERHPHSHHHGDGDWHHHDKPEVAPPSEDAAAFVQPHHPFHWPKISLEPLRRAVAALFPRADTDPNSDASGDGHHEHQSIFQLLAQGLVDQTPSVDPVLEGASAIICIQASWPAPVFSDRWEAQSASRGPPRIRG